MSFNDLVLARPFRAAIEVLWLAHEYRFISLRVSRLAFESLARRIIDNSTSAAALGLGEPALEGRQ